tara:strand:+ start:1831 stop:2442 length:612 start_codon:yes stop_codon:yes gene_type:complete
MKIESLWPIPVGITKIEENISDTILDFCKEDERNAVSTGKNHASKNKYILNSKEFSHLKTILHEKVNEYFNSIFSPSNDLSLVITQSWLNYVGEKESHHNHRHPNSFISGVFYINTQEDDRITFYNEPYFPFDIPTKQYNRFNSQSWWFPTEKNTLILFPSSLEHGIKQRFTKDNTRISLAFNTFFEGTLGEYETTTELKVDK